MHPKRRGTGRGVLYLNQEYEYKSENSSHEPPVRCTGHARFQPKERGNQ